MPPPLVWTPVLPSFFRLSSHNLSWIYNVAFFYLKAFPKIPFVFGHVGKWRWEDRKKTDGKTLFTNPISSPPNNGNSSNLMMSSKKYLELGMNSKNSRSIHKKGVWWLGLTSWRRLVVKKNKRRLKTHLLRCAVQAWGLAPVWTLCPQAWQGLPQHLADHDHDGGAACCRLKCLRIGKMRLHRVTLQR